MQIIIDLYDYLITYTFYTYIMNTNLKKLNFNINYIATNFSKLPLPDILVRIIVPLFDLMAKISINRIIRETWIVYRIDLYQTNIPSSEASLSPIDDQIIEKLRAHPDAIRNQFKSGIRFWDNGITNAYIWIEDEIPLCMQWLLFNNDILKLGLFSEWAGLYTPLENNTGQVENIFTFRHGLRRKKSAATEFEYALFNFYKLQGLQYIKTHIHESNIAAQRWAERVGFHTSGKIRRYSIHLPFLGAYYLYLHTPR
jgi:RimJ/RimL family protein N-acetyltransferase